MPLRAIARLIQTMLYAQRFFPYYVYNILGGIEEDGEQIFRHFRSETLINIRFCPTGSGAVYSFDPVGSYEREACRAAGAAQSLVQPFLDNQVCNVRRSSRSPTAYPPKSLVLVHCVTIRPLTDSYPPPFLSPDLLQEPDGSGWPVTPSAFAAIRRACNRH